MGLGFAIVLFLLGTVREILGKGSFFRIPLLPEHIEPIRFFVLPAGAFMVLGFFAALMKAILLRKERKQKTMISSHQNTEI